MDNKAASSRTEVASQSSSHGAGKGLLVSSTKPFMGAKEKPAKNRPSGSTDQDAGKKQKLDEEREVPSVDTSILLVRLDTPQAEIDIPQFWKVSDLVIDLDVENSEGSNPDEEDDHHLGNLLNTPSPSQI